MDPMAIVCILLLGTFVAILFIERAPGYSGDGTKNIASRYDGAKKSCNSNDFEDPVRVVTTSCPVWQCALIVLIMTAGLHVIAQKCCLIFSWKIDDLAFYTMDLVTGTFTASLFCEKRIFDDVGITVKIKLYVLLFVVYSDTRLIPWDQVQRVRFDYDYIYGKDCPFFKFITSKHTIKMNGECYGKHCECLSLAVNKLPAYKFTMDARDRLEEMGVWPL